MNQGPTRPIGKPVMPQPATFDERFIEAFENVAEMRSDIRHMDADITILKSDVTNLKSDVSDLKSDVSVLKSDVSVLKSDVSELKTDMSGLRVDMAEFKGEIQSDMTAMEHRLREHSSKQTWKSISIILPAVGVLVGLASYLGNISV